MPLTLLKYFLRRWALPLAGGILFFGGLLLVSDLVQISRDIFSEGASIRWLVPIMLTTLPETFAMVLPMAAILGGLIGTQQLSDGSEMVASQGLGVGIRSILKPWLLLSALLLVIATVNAHLVVPKVSSGMESIENRMVEEAKTRFLRPGAQPFFPPQNPQTGIWVAPDSEIHLFEVSPTAVQHLVAKDLTWRREEKEFEEPALYINLTDLKGCTVQKSDGNVGLIDQKSQSLRFDLPSPTRILAPTPVRYLSTSSLLDKANPTAWIEISRRTTLPVSTVALLLLGIALGLEHPRFRRGGALLKSLGVVLVYYLLLRYLENWYLAKKASPAILFTPPLLFFVAGFGVLSWKMRPHRSNRLSIRLILSWLRGRANELKELIFKYFDIIPSPISLIAPADATSPGVLRRWTRRQWWKCWGAALGTLLTLDLLIKFAPLAGELSKNGAGYVLFLQYWIWKLPSFLVIAFPISFLLGGVMVFSEAAMSREWVALRAGGASLLQWIGSGARAWIAVALLAFVTQAVIAPAMVGRADELGRVIKNKPRREYQTKPWLNLTSTGVLWFLDGDTRWGFPLKPPGEAPVLYRWNRDDARAEGLPWDGLHFQEGPEATDLFPSKALRRSASAEETNTFDLFNWQKWAPDPERATLLWTRLLNWLAGPCLMFAMLAHTFPAPRTGRGQVLGISLVVGLLFLGFQALFGGAARAGEIPALWGVAAPLLCLLGFGFLSLHRLRT